MITGVVTSPTTLFSLTPGCLARDDCLHQPCYCEENVWQLIPKRAGSPHQGGFVMWDYHVILIQQPDSPGTRPVLVWDLDTCLDFPCTAEQYAQQALKHQLMADMQRAGAVRQNLARYYRVVPAELYVTHFASDRRHMKRPSRPSSTPGSSPTSSHADDVDHQDGTTTSSHLTTSVDMTDPPHECAPAPGDQQADGPVPWLAPPPPWPPITAAATGAHHNLDQYWDVGPRNCTAHPLDDKPWLGCVYDEHDFVHTVLGVKVAGDSAVTTSQH